MTTYSENYNFALPEDKDRYDIAPISENFETLDSILVETETAMKEINTKIGSPTESGQTLFSLLGNSGGTGLTAIKSIQHVSGNYDGTKTSATLNIQTVVPANCFVMFERLGDESSGGCKTVNYNLTSNTIQITFNAYMGKLGFWIIEFC